MHAEHVLLVDDSPTDLLVIERALIAPSRVLVSARNAREALTAVELHDFAVALLDLQLPDMDGFDVARHIHGREATRDLPIIFITGAYSRAEHVLKGYDSGAVDFLLKPIQPLHLRSKVRVFCDLYRQRRVIQRQLDEIRANHAELQRRLDEIRVLRGLIPICASCKKVRDDAGYWSQIETYLGAHTGAEFSHGLCPACEERYYPELREHGEDSPETSFYALNNRNTPDQSKMTLEQPDAPVNLDRVQETSGGDVEFEKELFAIYLDDTEQRLAELRSNIAAGDADTAKRVAHTVKGSSANVGAEQVRAAAARLEQQIAHGGLAETSGAVNELDAAFRTAREYINQYLASLA